MTFKELTYSILEIISGYNITDDNEFSIKQIEEVMLGMNATLIREAYNNKKLSQSLYLVDEPIEIEKVSTIMEVEGVGVKTINKFCIASLKALVQGVGWDDVIYFGPTDYSKNYSRKSLRALINDSGSIWKLANPSYALSSNKAYLKREGISMPRYIAVQGLWRDPREVSGYSEDMEFPTPSEYKIQILTIQHMLIGKNIPPDLISDAQRQVTMPETRKKIPKERIENAESK